MKNFENYQMRLLADFDCLAFKYFTYSSLATLLFLEFFNYYWSAYFDFLDCSGCFDFIYFFVDLDLDLNP